VCVFSKYNKNVKQLVFYLKLHFTDSCDYICMVTVQALSRACYLWFS